MEGIQGHRRGRAHARAAVPLGALRRARVPGPGAQGGVHGRRLHGLRARRADHSQDREAAQAAGHGVGRHGGQVRRRLPDLVVRGDPAQGHGHPRLGRPGTAAHRQQRQLRLPRGAQGRQAGRRHVPGLQQLVPGLLRRRPQAPQVRGRAAGIGYRGHAGRGPARGGGARSGVCAEPVPARGPVAARARVRRAVGTGLRAGLPHLRARRIPPAPLPPLRRRQPRQRGRPRHAAARVARPRPRAGVPLRQHGHHGRVHLHRHPGALPQPAAGHPRVQRRLGAFLAGPDGRAHPRAQQRHGQRGGAPAHAAQRVLHAPDHGDLRQRRARAVLRGGPPGRRQHRLEHRLPASGRAAAGEGAP